MPHRNYIKRMIFQINQIICKQKVRCLSSSPMAQVLRITFNNTDYNYQILNTNPVSKELPADPESWFQGATEMAGSWWPDWQRWILASSKAQVPARQPGDGKLKAIEDAPGSYVQVRLS